MRSFLVIALLACFLLHSAFALDKSEDQATKFLVDEGQISDKAEVESFYVDKNGHVRITFMDNGKKLSFGLEEQEDTYEISYMSKKKDSKPKKKTATQQNDELAKLIGDNYSMLKGGKVISVTEDPKNRKKVNIEYSEGKKTYNIEAYYNIKRGQISISKVAEVDGKEQTL